MVSKIIIKPLAEIDLDNGVTWYTDKNENLGFEFLSDFKRAVVTVSQTPRLLEKDIKM